MYRDKRSLSNLNAINSNIAGIGLHSINTFGTIQKTVGFNSQFNEIYTKLNELRRATQMKVNTLNRGDTSMRNSGVKLAWKYENAELELGGKGTTNWSRSQRQEIRDNGKVRGAEGHHINNVKDHPELQANPDNIKFAETKDEHLNSKKFHNGNTKNPTHGKMVDRNSRLKKANFNRVIKNELKGIGLATAIGLGVGFTIGFIASIAQNGYSIESLKNAFVSGGELAIESSILGATNHIFLRTLGVHISGGITNMLVNNFGFSLTENLIRISNMATAGVICLAIYSTVIFTRLKLAGYDTKNSLIITGKTLIVPLSILGISIIAQGLWAGYAGIIVSISIGISLGVYQLIKTEHDKKIIRRIQYLSISKMKPSFS